MPTADSPDINGIAYDYSSIEIAPNSDINKAITSIDYSQALEPGEKRGTSPKWLGRTRGQYKPEASFSMYQAEAVAFIRSLGAGYMTKSFDIPVTFADTGQPTIKDRIVGCRIKKHSVTLKAGSDSPEVKFDLHVSEIFIDGLPAL